MSRNIMTIDQAALKRLEQYDFPGNVRELENMIERAIVVGNEKEVTERLHHSVKALKILKNSISSRSLTNTIGI